MNTELFCSCIKMPIYAVLLLVVCFGNLIFMVFMQHSHSELKILTDPKYGCEYVATSTGAGLYPRLDGEQHVGCKLNALIPIED